VSRFEDVENFVSSDRLVSGVWAGTRLLASMELGGSVHGLLDRPVFCCLPYVLFVCASDFDFLKKAS
jgi:hypothetical protein